MVKLFEKLFPGEVVEAESDFFDLGGDSLALVALCAELEESLGRDVHPSIVLNHPTVQELAAALIESSDKNSS
ncbi:phosphopantetheine-binding protein [Cognatiyoonia sediminum]|uniref:phosphopantetheine-binding protein n=1 Tax=Cognatiyoonia sediminum TaxID=1508389 RepID=UPI000934C32D